MAKHFISVCIFCFLCATHSPCESHAETTHSGTSHQKFSVPFAETNAPPAFQSDQNAPEEKVTLDVSNTNTLGYNLSVKNFMSNISRYAEPNNSTKLKRIRRNNAEVFRDKNFINSNNNVSNTSNINSDSSSNEHEQEYLMKIFAKYGDGKTLTMEGFEKLLNQLDLMAQILHSKLDPVLSLKNLAALISHETDNMTDTNVTCLKREQLLSKDILNNTVNNKIDEKMFQKVCPILLYNMITESCVHEDVEHLHFVEPTVPLTDIHYTVWLYSILAVVIISACGMLGLAVIPVMQKRYYQSLLQFLVALAVGTLAGDAFLHLLPHAMSVNRNHEHSSNGHSHHDSNHDENMWKGFVAMLGVVFFFVVERIIVIAARWRKERQLKQKLPKMKVMKEGLQPTSTGEKQCKHKYSSIPYCYDAIAMIDKNNKKDDYRPVFRLLDGQDNMQSHNNTATTALYELDSASELQPFKKSHLVCNNLETNQNMTECPSELNASNCTEVNKMLGSETEKDDTNSVEYTVILREHESKHHGHSHAHGHVHAAPKNMSSVAWMVIMGDGLHNFTDGMAIGAAFSGSIAGGFSTAVAVFCHELPHELGDFAMLLKAGMTIKQALFYNLLSSILCLLGNAFGVWLGNTENSSSWVFAVAAGTFVYIALVDMIPELSNGHEEEGTLFQSLLQLSGLLVGLAIMTFIALYEHDLKHMFHEPL